MHLGRKLMEETTSFGCADITAGASGRAFHFFLEARGKGSYVTVRNIPFLHK